MRTASPASCNMLTAQRPVLNGTTVLAGSYNNSLSENGRNIQTHPTLRLRPFPPVAGSVGADAGTSSAVAQFTISTIPAMAACTASVFYVLNEEILPSAKPIYLCVQECDKDFNLEVQQETGNEQIIFDAIWNTDWKRL